MKISFKMLMIIINYDKNIVSYNQK